MRGYIVSFSVLSLLAASMSLNGSSSQSLLEDDGSSYKVAAKTYSNLSKPIAETEANGQFGLLHNMFSMGTHNNVRDLISLSGPGDEYDNIFMLNSYPNASKTIFLDFDGAILEGTSWNLNASNSDKLIYPALHFDDIKETIIDERAAIYYTWAILSENFAQFDVNITTQVPDLERMIRTSEEDEEYGLHVIFTSHVLEGIEDCQCNGIAPISIFGEISNDSTPSPGFVNPKFGLGGYEVKSAIEAGWVLAHIGTHEIGHMLGLRHDGGGDDEEYSSPIGPISFFMGGTPKVAKYARWSNGQIARSLEETKGRMVNHQDDLSVLALKLGLKDDDLPNSVDSTDVPSRALEEITSGVLSHHTDKDVYKISIPTLSLLRVEVKPHIHNYQLATELQIFDQDFVPLNDFSRKEKWQTKLKNSKVEEVNFASDIEIVVVEPGTYYIQVEAGAGWLFLSDVAGQTYGSVGRWQATTDVLPLEEHPHKSENLFELYISLVENLTK